MKRLIILALLCTTAMSLLPGCEPATNEITVSKARTSSCHPCHEYPGTEACREGFLSVRGTQATRCYQCHAQSVVLDSILLEDDDTKFFSYFDAQDTTGGKPQPILSSAHANGRIDVDQGACNVCHGFPPAENERADLFNPDTTLIRGIRGHNYHSEEEDQLCYSCHATAIGHNLDSVVFTKKEKTSKHYHGVAVYNTIASRQLPIVDSVVHRNGHVDVSFFDRINEKTDTTFRWDPLTRSCSNIGCHEKPGLYRRTYWK